MKPIEVHFHEAGSMPMIRKVIELCHREGRRMKISSGPGVDCSEIEGLLAPGDELVKCEGRISGK